MNISFKCLLVFEMMRWCLGSKCGGNCPAGNCTECICGTKTDYQNIETWCSRYQWNQSCCECIVNSESKGNANAVRKNSDGSYSVGLFQIHEVVWGGCNRGYAPCDLEENLNCAIDVYKWGDRSFNYWDSAYDCGCTDSKLDNRSFEIQSSKNIKILYE